MSIELFLILQSLKNQFNAIIHIREKIERAEQIKKNIHEAALELSKQLEPLGLEPGPKAKNAVITLKNIGDSYPDFTDVRTFN